MAGSGLGRDSAVCGHGWLGPRSRLGLKGSVVWYAAALEVGLGYGARDYRGRMLVRGWVGLGLLWLGGAG